VLRARSGGADVLAAEGEKRYGARLLRVGVRVRVKVRVRVRVRVRI